MALLFCFIFFFVIILLQTIYEVYGNLGAIYKPLASNLVYLVSDAQSLLILPVFVESLFPCEEAILLLPSFIGLLSLFFNFGEFQLISFSKEDQQNNTKGLALP